MQNDQYDSDNDQRMNPSAGAWDSFADVPTEKAE